MRVREITFYFEMRLSEFTYHRMDGAYNSTLSMTGVTEFVLKEGVLSLIIKSPILNILMCAH